MDEEGSVGKEEERECEEACRESCGRMGGERVVVNVPSGVEGKGDGRSVGPCVVRYAAYAFRMSGLRATSALMAN